MSEEAQVQGWFTPDNITCDCGRSLRKKDMAFRKGETVVCRHCPDPKGSWVRANMWRRGKPSAIRFETPCARCGEKLAEGTMVPVWDRKAGGNFQVTGCRTCLTGGEWVTVNGDLEDPTDTGEIVARMGGWGKAWASMMAMADKGEEASLTSADVAFGSRDVLYTAFRELAIGDPALANCTPLSWLRAWSQCCAYGILPSKARGSDGYLYNRNQELVLHISYHAYRRMAQRENVDVQGHLVWGCMMTLGLLARPAQEAMHQLRLSPKGSSAQRQRMLAEAKAESERRAALWREDYEERQTRGAVTPDDGFILKALDMPAYAGAWWQYAWYYQRAADTAPLFELPPENLWPRPTARFHFVGKDGRRETYAVTYAPAGVLGLAKWQTNRGCERRFIFRPIAEVNRNATRGSSAKLTSDGLLQSSGTYYTDYERMVAKSGILGLVGAIPTAPLFSRALAEAAAAEEAVELRVIDAVDGKSLAEQQTALLLEANDEAPPDFRAMADELSAEQEAALVRITETPGAERSELYALVGPDWADQHPGDWPAEVKQRALSLLG